MLCTVTLMEGSPVAPNDGETLQDYRGGLAADDDELPSCSACGGLFLTMPRHFQQSEGVSQHATLDPGPRCGYLPETKWTILMRKALVDCMAR